MSVLDRIFRPTLARARRAAQAGRAEEAVRLFVEAGAVGEAEGAALAALDRMVALDDRVAFSRSVLRVFPGGQGGEALARDLGKTLTALASEGSRSLAERRLLRLEAAACLERAGLAVEAAAAFVDAGSRDEAARVLEAAGEVERLEALLAAASVEEKRSRTLRSTLAAYEDSMATGARREALAALRAATSADPGDATLKLARDDLERRAPIGGRVRFTIAGHTRLVLEAARVVLGREGDVDLRGASLSRQHACVERVAEGIRVLDLGSRNGTRVSGVPIGAPLLLSGASRLELGEDVAVRVSPEERGLSVEVVEGPDRGLRIDAGRGALSLEATGARIAFAEGWAVLTPGEEGIGLAGKTVHAPIDLVVGDRLELGRFTLEVLP